MAKRGRIHAVSWLSVALLALTGAAHAATNEDSLTCNSVLTVAAPDMAAEVLERKLAPVIAATPTATTPAATPTSSWV
jgi:hypothetical protein